MSAGQPALAHASTLLFVPATRPDRYAKALASGAGGVIMDLEDAVAPEAKAGGREQLAAGLAALGVEQRARCLVRINGEGTPWHGDDVAMAAQLVSQGLAGVVLPKAESASALAALARALGPQAALLPLLESAAGLDAIDVLARAAQVIRLAFGHLDFQLDLDMACAADEVELVPVRLALVLASRRAGLPAPLDGVTTSTGDAQRLQADAARSRRLGFGGKLCIHPAQLPVVRSAFEPDRAEHEWARRVLAAASEGGAVFSLDGRMVDAPVIRRAQRIVAGPF